MGHFNLMAFIAEAVFGPPGRTLIDQPPENRSDFLKLLGGKLVDCFLFINQCPNSSGFHGWDPELRQ